jgi:predicted nucleic acid-binding protein
MILLDTSALIEFLNHTGSPCDMSIETLIQNNADVAITDIILTEVLQGIGADKDYREIKTCLLTFPVITLNNSLSYIHAADMYRKCRTKGITIRSTIDLLIAQAAIEHDAMLLHNDRDFNAIASVSSLKLFELSDVA